MKKLLALLFVLAFISCKKTILYYENGKDFKDNRWMAGDVKNFEFELEREVAAAEIIMRFSHVHDSQFTAIPVEAIITYPSGEKEDITVSLDLKEEGGSNRLECLGDVCDLYTPLKEKVKLSKGKYRITLQNRFPNAYLPNTIAVGISVEKDN